MADSNLVTQLNYGVQAAEVITTPIDDTLRISGVAADAKATGDAIKEVSDYMGSGTIPGGANSLLEAVTDIITAIGNNALPTGTTTITGALSTLAGQIGTGISGETLTDAISAIRQTIGDAVLPEGATTVTEALNAILTAAVRSINGQTPDGTGNVQIGTGVMTVNGEEPDENGNVAIDTGLTRISVNGETPDENGEIAVPVGVKTINGEEPDENGNFNIGDQERIVRSVNGEEPDGNGNVTINKVPFADDLYTEDTQEITGAFIARAAGGSASIADATVTMKRVYGRTVRTGYIPTSREMSVSWGEREEGQEAIVASVDWDVFIAQISGFTTEMDITYDGEDWDYDLESYGVSIDSGTPVAGDVIHLIYVAEERGQITNAYPVSFNTTGWNLYDNSTGYARVVKYSEQYGYRIDGTYSTINFCTERGGQETEVAVDTNGLFNVPGDGYIHIVGGNNTDTAIYTTWSDWEDGTTEEFAAYSVNSLEMSEAIRQIFAAGMCSIGTIKDELRPNTGAYVRRINRIEYSEANLESVIAGGTAYTYDTDYIYYELAEPISGIYTMANNLPVSSHGIEFFDSEMPIECSLIYGQALKDKLRRNVLTISAQDLTDSQKQQARENIEAASKTELNNLDSGKNYTNDILADALLCTGTKLFCGNGGNYTGTIPEVNYKYGTFIVNVRGTIKTVIAQSANNSIAVNTYVNGAWTGWQTLNITKAEVIPTAQCNYTYGGVIIYARNNIVKLSINGFTNLPTGSSVICSLPEYAKPSGSARLQDVNVPSGNGILHLRLGVTSNGSLTCYNYGSSSYSNSNTYANIDYII